MRSTLTTSSSAAATLGSRSTPMGPAGSACVTSLSRIDSDGMLSCPPCASTWPFPCLLGLGGSAEQTGWPLSLAGGASTDSPRTPATTTALAEVSACEVRTSRRRPHPPPAHVVMPSQKPGSGKSRRGWWPAGFCACAEGFFGIDCSLDLEQAAHVGASSNWSLPDPIREDDPYVRALEYPCHWVKGSGKIPRPKWLQRPPVRRRQLPPTSWGTRTGSRSTRAKSRQGRRCRQACRCRSAATK